MSGYTIDGIDFMTEWNCQITDVSGHLGFPERKGPTEIDLGHNRPGALAYTDADDIRFEARDIKLTGVIQASTLARAHIYLGAMQSYLSSPGLHELELKHADNIYMVYLKDGGTVEPMGKWRTTDPVWRVNITLREPLPSFPAIWQDVQYYWNGESDKTDGNYYDFDGVDDYGSLGTDTKLDLGTGDGSVLMWVKSTLNTGSNQYLFRVKTGGEMSLLYYGANGVLMGYLDDGVSNEYSTGTETLAGDNTPHFLAWTIDRSSATGNKLYVDNIEVTYHTQQDITGLGDISPTGTKYMFTSDGSNRFFKGNGFRFQFWNMVPPDAVRTEIYETGIVPFAYSGDGASDNPRDEYTSGTLVIGRAYIIKTFVAGDDFTNVGAGSNASGVEFIATGTTPTTWTNSSTLERIGCVCDLNQNKSASTWTDDSGNGIDATMDTPALKGSAYPTVHEDTFKQSFAVSMWVKPDDGMPSAIEYFCGTKDTTPDNAFLVQLRTDGKIRAAYESNTNVCAAKTNAAVFSNGAETWHHFAVIVDSVRQQIDIWFDGVKQTLDNTDDGDMDGVTMSEYSNSNAFGWAGIIDDDGLKDMLSGEIDNYKLYNKKPSAEEMAVIYNKGR